MNVRVYLRGDVDRDGDVDIFDLMDTVHALGCCAPEPCYLPAADFDGNGCNDIFDVITCVMNFGAGM